MLSAVPIFREWINSLILINLRIIFIIKASSILDILFLKWFYSNLKVFTIVR
jgi:hypothetical protein